MTLVEPTGYSTDWAGPSARHADELPAYDAYRGQVRQDRAARNVSRGDPAATRTAILKVVDVENPPVRIFFGDGPLAITTADYESRLKTWQEWESVSVEAYGKKN